MTRGEVMTEGEVFIEKCGLDVDLWVSRVRRRFVDSMTAAGWDAETIHAAIKQNEPAVEEARARALEQMRDVLLREGIK